jgi:hypothetical protein
LSGFVRSENVGETPTLHEYGSGGKPSTWGSGEAFEEDINGDQDAVFLADEVSGMDVVHADSDGDVLEDEMVVK